MSSLNVFDADPFSAISMTAAVERVDYRPNLLGMIPGLFDPVFIRTTDVWIETQESGPALIQTTERGAPPLAKGGRSRSARSFSTLRLAQNSTIHADEIQNVRPFGRETDLMTMQQLVGERQVDMINDVELTREYHRLGAVQGILNDADGSELYNWASEFEQTIPTEVNLQLGAASPASGALRKAVTAIVRTMTRNLKGLGAGRLRISALCGDDFWDALIAHPEVRETYLNQAEASELREAVAWETFRFGGVTWINYRGTDDGTTVAVPSSKAKFFPVGVGIFKEVYAPAETMDFVNTRGRRLYSWIVRDRDRNAWVQPEVFCYPLFVCTMPQALHRARLG